MSNAGATKLHKAKTFPLHSRKKIKTLKLQKGWLKGVLLTLILAVLASSIAKFPIFSVMGIMIVSILLGMSWKGIMEVPGDASAGITFSSKTLLRAGIILMGLRLNVEQIFAAGFSLIIVDIIVIVFTLVLMMYIGKFLSIDRHLSTLIAVGTAICGAAAIVAVAPLIRAKNEFTAISVAFIAIMGTIVTIIYTFMFPVLDLSPRDYGVLTGATLHELAHVIAASAPGGDVSSDTAILVKLGRVALLIPAAIILGMIFNKNSLKKQKTRLRDLPVPWFIFGFLFMCLVNTAGILSDKITQMLIALSIFLLSMAMAGLGLGVNYSEFKKLNRKVIFTGVFGAAALAALGFLIVHFI
ncbi:YeiH family protein [Cytobacillus firmus]|uniref:YeiH family protein n=1 Tax=Cytobacillus firmus TaxID=1399 RepID=UPI00222839E4|nr:YeiH family protein [Cytobacillus firmus]